MVFVWCLLKKEWSHVTSHLTHTHFLYANVAALDTFEFTTFRLRPASLLDSPEAQYKAVLSRPLRAHCVFCLSACHSVIFNMCVLSYLSHSNTSMRAEWAWRKRSWRRVQIWRLYATPCLCTRRPRTSSSGSLSFHRMLRVRLQRVTVYTHTHTLCHEVGSDNFTQKCFQLSSKSSTAYSFCYCVLWS